MALIKEFDPDSGKTYDKMGLPITSNILYALIALKMHICLEKLCCLLMVFLFYQKKCVLSTLFCSYLNLNNGTIREVAKVSKAPLLLTGIP